MSALLCDLPQWPDFDVFIEHVGAGAGIDDGEVIELERAFQITSQKVLQMDR